MPNTAVITGATGHIGLHVARLLQSRGYELVLLVRRLTPEVAQLQEAGARLHFCDLKQPKTYRGIFAGQDVLFHMAAENTTDTSDEARVISATLGITVDVVSLAISEGVGCIVYTSTVVALGRSTCKYRLLNENSRNLQPESPYVKGKCLAEAWVAEQVKAGFDIRRVYPSWVVGPGDPKMTPPHKFIQEFSIKGQSFYFEGGVSIVHVEDVALGHVLAYENGLRQGQYILSGENLTFDELYGKMSNLFGVKRPRVKLPKTAIWLAAKILGKNSPISASYVNAVINRYSWYDNSYSSRSLGWPSPRSADVALESACHDIRAKNMGTFELRDRNTSADPSGALKGTLLITGFPGWLGNRMVDILVNGDVLGRNKTVRNVRLLVQPQFLDLVPKLPSNFEIVEGDITDIASLKKAAKDVSTVWHLAGVIYPRHPRLYDLINAKGTRNLADACVANGVTRFLYMSTDSCCGFTPPGTVFSSSQPAKPYKQYGQSKLSGESYIMSLTSEGRLKATILRGFWFFGPNPPVRNLGFLRSFKWPIQLVFGNGRNFRSISHCDDLVNAFCLAEVAEASVGRWYWLPSFLRPHTVDGIYRMIGSALGRRVKLVHIPNFFCEIFSVADSLCTKRLKTVNSTLLAAGKFHKTIATDEQGAAPARQDFGWEPAVTEEQIKSEIADALINL